MPVAVTEAAVNRATPKSMIFTVPSSQMKMLAGLTSRWTMPVWWAWASPSRTCRTWTGWPTQDLQDDRHLAVEGERDPQAQRLEQVLPLEQLHGDVWRAVG